ncbi:hypothetical protein LSCM1_07792 [Leishmania martiniquensis]|uniref:Uncharacterized protein n=1 Tax=Leishmania martiniquensis TaxID=1580590 RepID=A0A836H972_9TRYP|nr:hypothetical protein LSCM1_07792 [Leishmania martiniquensis]
MSRLAEGLVDAPWGYSEPLIGGLKAVSRSLVEEGERISLLPIFLGVPAVLVMVAISRCIDRAHNRVRYASEYCDFDGNDYVTSSSDSSNSRSNSDDDAAEQGNRRLGRRPTIDEVVQAAQQLTDQETARLHRAISGRS